MYSSRIRKNIKRFLKHFKTLGRPRKPSWNTSKNKRAVHGRAAKPSYPGFASNGWWTHPPPRVVQLKILDDVICYGVYTFFFFFCFQNKSRRSVLHKQWETIREIIRTPIASRSPWISYRLPSSRFARIAL